MNSLKIHGIIEFSYYKKINVAKMEIIHTMLKKWWSSSYKYLPKSGYKHKMKHTCLIILPYIYI